ncbi:MAG: hypothetical protein FWG10_10235 [Eubacteriaceae bacterium]|nr:hypothetical protein [Eubacteriaceae bacterium]
MAKKYLLALLLMGIYAITSMSCKPFVEHSKAASDIANSWVLDSVYLDTKAIEANSDSLALGPSHTGRFSSVKLVIHNNNSGSFLISKVGINEDGTANEEQIETSTISFTLSNVGEGSFTMNVEGSPVSYKFSVDKPASLMHLYRYASDGGEYHFYYRKEGVV